MNENIFPSIGQFSEKKSPLACVDIGGTKVAVSVADQFGIRSKISEPTVKVGDTNALGDQVIRLIAESCKNAGISISSVEAVGVSSCGPFILKNGLVELAAPNICGGLNEQANGLPNSWRSAPLEAPLRTEFKNVRVENDGIGALEAERRWGALRGISNCAYVTWSTGIGMGVCVDGHVLRGKNGNAGHLGHTFVVEDSQALCGCGLTGDVESLAAGSAISRRFSSRGYSNATTLFAMARAGESVAVATVDDLCAVFGRALFNAIALFDLQSIALGGSVFWHNQDYLLPRLTSFMHGKLPALTDGIQIVPAGLGEKVGDFAALALIN